MNISRGSVQYFCLRLTYCIFYFDSYDNIDFCSFNNYSRPLHCSKENIRCYDESSKFSRTKLDDETCRGLQIDYESFYVLQPQKSTSILLNILFASDVHKFSIYFITSTALHF